jgi:hypothetical protein
VHCHGITSHSPKQTYMQPRHGIHGADEAQQDNDIQQLPDTLCTSVDTASWMAQPERNLNKDRHQCNCAFAGGDDSPLRVAREHDIVMMTAVTPRAQGTNLEHGAHDDAQTWDKG